QDQIGGPKNSGANVVHESGYGTSRHFTAMQQVGRFRSEADIEPDLQVHGLGRAKREHSPRRTVLVQHPVSQCSIKFAPMNLGGWDARGSYRSPIAIPSTNRLCIRTTAAHRADCRREEPLPRHASSSCKSDTTAARPKQTSRSHPFALTVLSEGGGPAVRERTLTRAAPWPEITADPDHICSQCLVFSATEGYRVVRWFVRFGAINGPLQIPIPFSSARLEIRPGSNFFHPIRYPHLDRECRIRAFRPVQTFERSCGRGGGRVRCCGREPFRPRGATGEADCQRRIPARSGPGAQHHAPTLHSQAP